MKNQNNEHEKISFEDLLETRIVKQNIVWNHRLNTKIAHPSGRIPSLSATAGWQPIYLPGTSKFSKPQSATIRGLVRRVRMTRGEAL